MPASRVGMKTSESHIPCRRDIRQVLAAQVGSRRKGPSSIEEHTVYRPYRAEPTPLTPCRRTCSVIERRTCAVLGQQSSNQGSGRARYRERKARYAVPRRFLVLLMTDHGVSPPSPDTADRHSDKTGRSLWESFFWVYSWPEIQNNTLRRTVLRGSCQTRSQHLALPVSRNMTYVSPAKTEKVSCSCREPRRERGRGCNAHWAAQRDAGS